jgi:NAD(P)-dependent dehydrogenase (short-subunit alcohol dehydrogenase family)
VTAHWSTESIPDQRGRVAVVTGANSGLGYHVALALAVAGAQVVLACRNIDKAKSAITSIRALVPASQVTLCRLDLADLGSVAQFADNFRAEHDRLDLLVNNAGLMAVDQSCTVDGFETQIGVNHLGPFALTAHLLPTVLSTPGARVVSMSSMGHRQGRLVVDDLMFERTGLQPVAGLFSEQARQPVVHPGAAASLRRGGCRCDRRGRPPWRGSDKSRLPGARHQQCGDAHRPSHHQSFGGGGAAAVARSHRPLSPGRAVLRAQVAGFRSAGAGDPQPAGSGRRQRASALAVVGGSDRTGTHLQSLTGSARSLNR